VVEEAEADAHPLGLLGHDQVGDAAGQHGVASERAG
jgi:hypothetical protein